MSLTLDGMINETSGVLSIAGDVPAEITPGAYRFRFDDSSEILDLVGFGRTISNRGWPVDRNVWIVTRGALDSEPTPHDGATVEAVVDAFVASDTEEQPDPIPESGDSGGGLTGSIVTKHLTSADILTLNSDPFEVAPAVTGRVYWPVNLFVYYHMGGVAYSSGGATFIGPSTTSLGHMGPKLGIDVLTDAQDRIGSAVISEDAFRPYEYDIASNNVGQPLVFRADADPADGDGTLDVTVEYRWLDVTYFDHIEWGDQPQDADAFVTLPPMTLRAIDNHGDLFPWSATAVLQVTTTPPDDAGVEANIYDFVDGVCTLSDVAIENAGTWTLTAYLATFDPFGGLIPGDPVVAPNTSAISAPFTVTAP